MPSATFAFTFLQHRCPANWPAAAGVKQLGDIYVAQKQLDAQKLDAPPEERGGGGGGGKRYGGGGGGRRHGVAITNNVVVAVAATKVSHGALTASNSDSGTKSSPGAPFLTFQFSACLAQGRRQNAQHIAQTVFHMAISSQAKKRSQRTHSPQTFSGKRARSTISKPSRLKNAC